MFDEKTALRIPGPTPISPSVFRAMTHAMVGHRSSDFSKLLADVESRLRPLFGTAGDVAIIAGTGTAALEAALVNMVARDEEVLAITNGNFGERFLEIARRASAVVHHIAHPWGAAAHPDEVEKAMIEHPLAKVVLVTHCETSTGVLNDIQAIAGVVRARGGYLIVDAVSSFLGTPIEMDAWGVDMVATGSQKALGLPPGLALVAMGERALLRVQSRTAPTLYFDLARYHKDLAANTTPWTPAISLVYGLQAALDLVEHEGLPAVYKRHLQLRDMTRNAMKALNLPLLVEDDRYASPTVTTVKTPGFDADAFRKVLKNELHVSIAGGQKQLAGQIVRIGHMGYADASDMLQCIAAMEIALTRIGRACELGAGVRAASEVFLRD